MIRGPNRNLNPNMNSVINSASFDRVNEYLRSHREIKTTQSKRQREALERLQRSTDLEVMDDQRLNMTRQRSPPNVYVPTSPKSPGSESSGSVQIVDKPKPEVIDLSIDEIGAIFMNNVTEQAAQAEAQAKADSDAEEAKRNGQPVKRKQTADTSKPSACKDPPGPDKDEGKRQA
jgi:hypothetical protein